MSTETTKQSPEKPPGGGAGSGVEGGGMGRSLPRLFSEMAEVATSTGVDPEAGVAGGSEGVGAEGGAPREELWDSPVESIGEGGREEDVAAEGPMAEDAAPGEDHAFDEDYETPALGGRRKGSPRRKLRPFEVKLGPAQVGLTAEQRMLVLDT